MYDFLKEFESPEGHWDDFDILKPIVIHLYNKYKIESILEIGFNIGHSATLFLDYCPNNNSRVTSVDVGIHKDTLKASEAVKGHFGNRFRFHLLNSKYIENTLKHDSFDLAFIDGDHTHQGVFKDIQSCINLKYPIFCLMIGINTTKKINTLTELRQPAIYLKKQVKYQKLKFLTLNMIRIN